MKNLAKLLTFLLPFYCYGELPEQYLKKNYVEYSSQKVGSKYFYKYEFKDEANELIKWQWWVPTESNDYATDLFGIPLDRIQGNQIRIVSHDMRYFIQEGGVLRPDYTGLLNIYRPISYPLYRLYSKHVREKNLYGRQKIEFLLRMLQDYPYGLVPPNFGDKFVNGLLPVSEVFKTGWADCDSKSMVMATILSYDPDFYDKLAIIGVPGHALLGIEGIPRPYEKYATYRGKKYIYAEPVGSLRTAFGRTNSPYTRSIQVYPLEVFNYDETPAITPQESENISQTRTDDIAVDTAGLTDSDCPEGAFLLKYDLPNGTKKQQCALSKSGQIINHGPELIFNADGTIKENSVYEMGTKVQ